LLALLFAGALHALPLACEPGRSCWVVNHVDMAAGPDARDYACGPQTYDGHDGTDIAVTGAAMRAGVPVLASAPGTVRNMRDGEPDGGPVAKGRDCGNGVLVEHGDGWQTQYCHLRQGSVRVRRGERVERGTPLGLVGQSGRAEFPHLHWTLRREGKALDPFTGRAAGAGCGAGGAPLWDAPRYLPAAIFAAGLTGERPQPREAYDNDVKAPQASSPALLIWAAFYGVRAGDTIELTVRGPDGGELVRARRTAERTLARFFVFSGKRRPGEQWAAGTYRGRITLERNGFAVERSVEAIIGRE